jgi:lysozyme
MNSDLLAQELERDEGKKNMLYRDSIGIWSIGIGRNLQDRGLSDDEILYLLKNDMNIVFTALDTSLPWWRSMTENRQRVLANMCFNLGINRLMGFKNTLLSMSQGDYAAAAAGMLASRWATQVGDRAKRLAAMMEQG